MNNEFWTSYSWCFDLFRPGIHYSFDHSYRSIHKQGSKQIQPFVHQFTPSIASFGQSREKLLKTHTH